MTDDTDEHDTEDAGDEAASTGGDQAEASDDDENDDDARYKRGVAVTLAVLAVLGAWVAVLQTNASTNESSTTRQATRLAAQAQSASVIEKGGVAAVDQVAAEIDILADRPGLTTDPELAADLGVTLDPERATQRVEAAREAVLNSLSDERGELFDLQEEARRLALTQDQTVSERITWNARASQYDTVLTVLGVSLFLIGFTAVVGRILRPPLAVPGLLLAM